MTPPSPVGGSGWGSGGHPWLCPGSEPNFPACLSLGLGGGFAESSIFPMGASCSQAEAGDRLGALGLGAGLAETQCPRGLDGSASCSSFHCVRSLITQGNSAQGQVQQMLAG